MMDNIIYYYDDDIILVFFGVVLDIIIKGALSPQTKEFIGEDDLQAAPVKPCSKGHARFSNKFFL